MENQALSVTVILRFSGAVPPPFAGNPLFAEYQGTAEAAWPDPGTPGSAKLRAILAEAQRNSGGLAKVHSLTASLETPAEGEALASLLGLADQMAAQPWRDADALLVAGLALSPTLMQVEVQSARLLPSGVVARTTQQAERRLYVMNSNGLCFVVDAEIALSPEKLANARFFASEEALDAAGISLWGENGSQMWRCRVSNIDGRACALTEYGNVIDLGEEPEIALSSFSH